MAIPVAYFVVSATLLNWSWVVVEVVNILGFPNEESAAVPDTTPVNQYSHFYAYVVEYWNSCLANEVTETTMYDTLQKLYKEFTTMLAVFPYFWKVCAFGFRRVVDFVFLKYFGQSGLKVLAIKFFLRLTMFFLELFEPILCLLRG